VTRDVLVLHRVGDPRGGSPWRDALGLAGWPGRVLAPDLPGHGETAAPVGGNYELVDAAIIGAGLVAGLTDTTVAPVVVGVGTSGWAAQVLALGGRAGALVLVDGLGGPWLEPAEAVARNAALLRALAQDPDAMGPPPAAGFDPRLRHGILGQTDRPLALRAAAALEVPVLVVETPESGLRREEADEVIGAFRDAHQARAATVDDIAAATVAWAGGLPAPC